tara:strand:- start:605 stop:1462 length:858 start_codon:yes stop_codon:yes gene_type:complete
MNTELAIQKDLGMSLAEAVGVNSQNGGERKSSILARVNLMHTGIMGEIEVNGKPIKTEVVPAGAYKVTRGEDDVVYATSPTIRIFAIRQQWSKWDAKENMMMKTVMANDLKGDLKDNVGTFNLGRPSGYIEDWDSVPEKTKELIRTINRKKIIFGLMTATGVTDESGNPVDAITDMPFSLELPPSSIKPLDLAVNALRRKNILPIQCTFKLGHEPGGENYVIISLEYVDKLELQPEDQDTLHNFLAYITAQNSNILEQWDEKNKDAISDDDAAIVAEFVNVEEAD